MNGRTGPTGALVPCHAAVERRREVDIVYSQPTTITRVSDPQRKFTDALDISAQVSKV